MKLPRHHSSEPPPRTRADSSLIVRTLCTLLLSPVILLFAGHSILPFGLLYVLAFTEHWENPTPFRLIAITASTAASLMIIAMLLLYKKPNSRATNPLARVTILFSTLTLSACVLYYLSQGEVELLFSIATSLPFFIAAATTLLQIFTPQHPSKETLHPVQPPK